MKMETEKVKRLTREEFLERGYADLWLDGRDLPVFRKGSPSAAKVSDIIHDRLYFGTLEDWLAACGAAFRTPGWFAKDRLHFTNLGIERGRFNCRLADGDGGVLECYADIIDSPDGPLLFCADWGTVIRVNGMLLAMRDSNPDRVTKDGGDGNG